MIYEFAETSLGRLSCSANVGARARLEGDCNLGVVCGFTTGNCFGCEVLKLQMDGVLPALLPGARGRPTLLPVGI